MKGAFLPWYAWPLSAGSLIVLAVVVAVCKFPLDQLEKSLRAKEVRKSVRHELYDDALVNAQGLFGMSLGERAFHAISLTRPLVWTASKSVEEIIQVIAALRRNDGTLLLGLLGAGSDEYDSEPEPESSLRPMISEGLDALRADFRRFRELRGERAIVSERRRKLQPEYLLIRENLAVFFGLRVPENDISENSEDNPYPLYESGILRGLPLLPKIPDGLNDPPALKRALDEAHGQVKTTGSNPAEEFNAVITDLKKKASRIDATLEEVQAQISFLEAEEEAVEERSRMRRKVLRSSLENELETKLNPPPLSARLDAVMGK